MVSVGMQPGLLISILPGTADCAPAGGARMMSAVIEFFSRLFSADFMPHEMCFLGDAGVTWLNVISDWVIALAYYLIPFLLFRLVRKRRDIEFKWAFVAFGLFIVACGTTHV